MPDTTQTDQAFIDEHCDVGTIGLGALGYASALACKRCGAFLWNVRTHVEVCHA